MTMSGSPPTADRPVRGLSERTLSEIEEHLKLRERQREGLFERARHLRRLSQGLMTRLHEGLDDRVPIQELKREASQLLVELRGPLQEEASLAHDALQEYAEAVLLDAVIHGAELPGPAELGIPVEPYLLGVGDLVGEVRRLTLRALADGEIPRAEHLVALMQKLYHDLMRFDAPRSIVAMKPKQDTARALLERTRGDLVLAQMLARARLPVRAAGDAK
jgi:translin